MHSAAAAVAGSGSAVAFWTGNYNRENFQYDSEMRFQRFNTARGYANSQVGQYREDIRGMTELTAGKQDTIYTVSTLMMCVCAALSCAGRIGMHGAAPPGYLCGLYSGHIFTAILYLTLAMWLALHASLRAQCGMVSLLTRKVRLPIPSLSQLDQARNFGSAFEKQEWSDIFRVPFMSHPQAAPDALEESSGDSDNDHDAKAGKKSLTGKKGAATKEKAPSGKTKKKNVKHDPREEFGSSSRAYVPSWIRDEQVVDKGLGLAGGRFRKEAHDVPEHFELYANAQAEWWPYDVYARICMLYGVMQFLFAVSYYIIGTAIAELRGFWIMWAVPMVFLIAQVLILRLDTLRQSEGQQMLPHLEWAGHIAPYLIIAACTLDYRLTYTPGVVTLTWALVYAGFFGHFLFAIRLLDLAWPCHYRETDMPDLPGKEWWPASWKLPPAFSKALWIVAPPKKLERGQHCLINEMKALSHTGGGVAADLRHRKNGSAKGGARKPVPLKDLKAQIRRIDGHFEWWDKVFAQVPDITQRKLKDLQFDHETVKREVEQLTKAAGSPQAQQVGKDSGGRDKFDADRRNVAAAKKLGEIEEALEEVDRTTKVEAADSTRSGGEGAYTHRSPFKGFSDKRHPDLPWQLTRAAILTVAGCWLWMILGTTVEIALGPNSILKPPGEPPWIRDQKLRRWTPEFIHTSQQATPEGYRLFNAVPAKYLYSTPDVELSHHLPVLSWLGGSAEHAASGHSTEEHSGHSRRLASQQNHSERVAAALDDLVKTLPSLGWLADALEERDASTNKMQPVLAAGDHAKSASRFMAPPLRMVPASWPSFFEPQHLICSPKVAQPMVVALTSRGFGAILNVRTQAGTEMEEARSFSMQGISDVGPLAGASWAETGMWLVSRAGHLLHCPGHGASEAGLWSCQNSDAPRLPLPQGVQVTSAAVLDSGFGPGMRRLVALQMAHLPETVAIYAHEGNSWNPAGQVHVPSQSEASPGARGCTTRLAFDGTDLLISTCSGEVHRRSTTAAGGAAFHPSPSSRDAAKEAREWRAACALPSAAKGGRGKLLRLALRRSEAETGFAWRPELITTA